MYRDAERFRGLKQTMKAKLGNPYYENDHCLLFCMDMFTAQKRLDDGIWNTVITSPPYNIGKEYEEERDLGEYIDWCARWITETTRLLKTDGAMLLNLGYTEIQGKARAIPIPYLLWDKVPMYLNQEIVWNYSAGVACRHYLSPRNEKILWYVKDRARYTFNLDSIRDQNIKYPNSRKNGKPRVNTLGKNPSDVWEIAKITTGLGRSSRERTPHPCQFPLDLINRLVLGFSNENDIICDPFMGSGTTFEACIQNGRYCVGFEIREDYCAISQKRIENSAAQLSFAELAE